MKAAALLQRLPHSADTERRRHPRRQRAKRAPITTTAATASAAVQREKSALARAREAGGPMDSASYACACGYVFAASVSTTVSCPHCGAGQAW